MTPEAPLPAQFWWNVAVQLVVGALIIGAYLQIVKDVVKRLERIERKMEDDVVMDRRFKEIINDVNGDIRDNRDELSRVRHALANLQQVVAAGELGRKRGQ